MILFINGAFGVGKTTVAEQLVRRFPNSLLFDAEEVGFFLRNIVRPIEKFEDFQDVTMWRTLTITTAQLLWQTYGRTLIMPMTIWYRPYFDEVMSGLRQFEPDLLHFCLTARAETIRDRLFKRGDTPASQAWCFDRVEQCVAAFKSPMFALHVVTDERTVEEVVEAIVGLAQEHKN